MLYAIVAVLVILADQLIKLYVSADGFHTMELIPGLLNLTKVENTGGAFGLLGGEIPTYWFIIIAAVFTILVVIALSTKFIKGWLARWSIVLVTAGGISNCIDRVINVRPTGHVVDMFQFDFWKSFPVFNLADIFISVSEAPGKKCPRCWKHSLQADPETELCPRCAAVVAKL